MATVALPPPVRSYRDEGFFLFKDGGWELYDRLDAWASSHPGTRLFCIDGDVVVMGISRRHDWYSRRLFQLVYALADRAKVDCDHAGSTTFREVAKKAGAQADEAFYLGANASRMAGPKAFEAGVDPVPDLVIEIEVGNPVETALRASARLGVPEVWHLDATHDELELRVLRLEMDGASYTSVSGSGFLPVSSRDILQLLVPSLDEGAQNWRGTLSARIDQVIVHHGRA